MKLDRVVALVLTFLVAIPVSASAWEPTKPIDFVVPAGTGEFFKAEDHVLQGLHVRDLG